MLQVVLMDDHKNRMGVHIKAGIKRNEEWNVPTKNNYFTLSVSIDYNTFILIYELNPPVLCILSTYPFL